MSRIFALAFFIAITIQATTNKIEQQTGMKYVHPTLLPYFEEFLHLTGYNVKEDLVVIEFTNDMHPRVLGIAIGMHVDNVIYIKINYKSFNRLSDNQKYYVMMHELGHDLLNWEHGHNYTMGTPLPYFVTNEHIDRIKKELIDYAK